MADWDKISSRGNVDDRRSMAPIVGGVTITGIVLSLAILFLTKGEVAISPEDISSLAPRTTQTTESPEFKGEDEYEVFVSTVLGSTNEMWNELFAKQNMSYSQPTLVLFRDATESQCGGASSSLGPHYCSLDYTIYLDETFFDTLTEKFGAQGGDVAQAYIIAHEVGHHVQNQLGIIDQVLSQSSRNSDIANDLSIKMELQADCYAGLWSNYINNLDVLSPGEISEAMDAAASVGDDRVQEKAEGRVTPENWTHGSSEQRVGWFTTGYNSNDMGACDTFK